MSYPAEAGDPAVLERVQLGEQGQPVGDVAGVGGGELALGAAYERNALSARGRHRVLRVARTIADLDGRDRVSAADVLMAVSLRHRDGAEGALAA